MNSFRRAAALLLSIYGLATTVWGAPTAVVDGGVVVGTITTLSSATAPVNKFLGVPFAASPPLRFAPPQPVKHFAQKSTMQLSPACIQQFNFPEASRNFTIEVFSNPPPEESEDCLYLNVFAPSTPAPPRTVMVWIYGGALQFGNAGQPTYDGSSFAAYQDVIVVTFNYRTNVFGFPGSPELPLAKRNVGYLDQRFALQWVQRNIRAFGGDPKKVTIFGESAGAASVDRLVVTHPNNPPFRAAIMESGTASVGTGGATNSTVLWEKLVVALGCSKARSPIACVRAKDALTIKSIIEHQDLVFNPVTDGITQLAHPEAARLAGNIAKVPTLQGTNSQEGRAFVVGDNDVAAFLNSTFKGVPALQQAILAAYPVGQGGLNTPFDAIAQIFTELVFQCPCAIVTADSAKIGLPTWRYYFNASFPDTKGFPDAGVFHSSEIPVVFGTYEAAGSAAGNNLPPTAQEFALSQYMQGAWAKFAKNPQGGPGWNKIGAFGNLTVGDLGPAGSSGVTVIDATLLDARCKIFAPVYAAVTSGPTF